MTLKGEKMDSITTTILATEDGKAKYDDALKSLLSNRQILSWILKSTVPEFMDCTLEDIEQKYIEPDSISVSQVFVGQNLTNIEGTSNEDKTLNEGNVYFDIVFKAVYPGNEGSGERKLIPVFINIEAQNSYYPGYPIEKRAIYYASRKLNSQLRSINPNTDYGILQKVYSIWLCIGNVPNKDANTITLYTVQKHDILGIKETDPDNYRLINAVVVRMNDNVDPATDFLKLLQTLCSNLLGKAEKLKELNEIGLRLDHDLEGGINRMCNVSDYIWEKAATEGMAQGMAQGLEKGTADTIRRIVTSMLQRGDQPDAISEVTGCPLEDIKKIAAELQNS